MSEFPINSLAERLLFEIEVDGWDLRALMSQPEPFPWVASHPDNRANPRPFEEVVAEYHAKLDIAEQLPLDALPQLGLDMLNIRVLGGVANRIGSWIDPAGDDLV